MFFSYKEKAKAKAEIDRNNETTKNRFAEKLAAITEINALISEAVVTTQAANCELLDKLKTHMKNGSRTFKSLSDKLFSGVLILDHQGTILQSNPKAREIFHVKGDTCRGLHISELISEILPIFPPHHYFKLTKEFFQILSDAIDETLLSCAENRNACIANCLKHTSDLPVMLDEHQLVQVTSPNLATKPYMKFTLSILGNDPEKSDDVTYVLIFGISKSSGSVTPARRFTD